MKNEKKNQKNHMATDPVMNIKFPKSVAFGINMQLGSIFPRNTKKSMLAFEDAPLNLLTCFKGIDPNANHCI